MSEVVMVPRYFNGQVGNISESEVCLGEPWPLSVQAMKTGLSRFVQVVLCSRPLRVSDTVHIGQ